MTKYVTEQEQIDQLKRWLRIYLLPGLAGLLVGIGIFYLWQFYYNHRNAKLEQASIIYDNMVNNYIQHNLGAASEKAAQLDQYYPHTSYNLFAKFMLAKTAILHHDYPQAIAKFAWIIKNSRQPEMKQLARLRLARVYLEQQNPQQALAILTTIDSPEFNGLINEIKGDAYVSMKQFKQAKSAYQQALADLPNATDARPLLQMKFDNLA